MTEGRRQAAREAPRDERRLRKLLLVAGAVELAAGALHFAMPSQAYRSRGFANLQPDELGLVTLLILAVGLLLLVFGTLTVYLASRTEVMVEILFGYALIKTVLWTGRVLLEAAYPVRLRLFSVEPFTVVVTPLLVLELMLFAASAVLARKVMVAGAAEGDVVAG